MRLLLLLLLSLQANARQLVILSLGKDNALKTFELNAASGELTPLQTLAIAESPGAFCLSPSQEHLYLSLKGSGEIASCKIAESGELTLLKKTPVGAGAAYLQVHPTGKHLLAAYFKEGKASVHSILPDGTLSDAPTHFGPTDERAHAIVCDPSGKFVFVPHTRPNSIHQFRLTADGSLTPNEPPILQREEKSGPRHLWFHPNGEFAYGSDEQGRGATAYAFEQSRGTLTVLETVASPAPGDHEGKHNTSDIEVHPSGKFLFLANRGHNVIATYSIDEQSGALKPLQQIPTEAVTRSFNISPDGKHLVAAGQTSGNLAVFSINEDGTLKRRSTLQVGQNPWWVEIIER